MINYKDEYYIKIEEKDLPKIKKELCIFIEQQAEDSILEKILEFCEIHEYRVEEISDLIKQDKVLKNLLYQDCTASGVIRTKKKTNKIDNW